MATVDEVISFWLDQVGPKGWYNSSDALDAQISQMFGGCLDEARAGALGLWLTSAKGTLAYLILTDQFTRNMFRDGREAFAYDGMARAAAKMGIEKGWDMKIPEPERQFFYLPLMHSENLIDQDRCVRLMCERLPAGPDNLRHARAHRCVIRQFGRFPYRNGALSRPSTAAEKAWMAAGGYRLALEDVDAAAPA